MSLGVDPLLIVLGVLLAASLGAFVMGFFPYPYGWMVLSALFVARWLSLRGLEK